ncbi:hypothetical protein [Actinosynnema mirum]|nr:hypothetical protein [Actinosynnema mirum]
MSSGMSSGALAALGGAERGEGQLGSRPFRLLIGGIVLVGGLVVAAALLFGGSGSGSRSGAGTGSDDATAGGAGPAEPKSGPFTLRGTMTLMGGGSSYAAVGDCEGTRGYDDISEGTQVSVYDASGTIVAISELTNSNYLSGGMCRFNFAVPDVPDGERIYQVEVSHRGKISYTEKDARAGAINLTLG